MRRRELDGAYSRLTLETALAHRPIAEGDYIAGAYRQRVTLASGRFAVIDDGLGFELVPWQPALEQQISRQISGMMMPGGGVNWSFGRKLGMSLSSSEECNAAGPPASRGH